MANKTKKGDPSTKSKKNASPKGSTNKPQKGAPSRATSQGQQSNQTESHDNRPEFSENPNW